MKGFKKLCVSAISLILCIAMLAQTVAATVTEPETIYVKDLKIIYADSGSDLNANEGYRWMSLYTTCRASVGNPIEADFLVVGESGVGF